MVKLQPDDYLMPELLSDRIRHAVVFACLAALLSLGALPLRAASASAHGGLRSYASGAGPVSVAVGDLNGDGKPDLVTANLYANTISVFLNRAGGSFKPRRDYRLLERPPMTA
jgi:FG-GAP repeat